jgi:hypothetical protein
MGRVCGEYWGRGKVHIGILKGEPDGKRPLGRSRLRWEDKMDIQERGCGGLDWIDLAQDRDR